MNIHDVRLFFKSHITNYLKGLHKVMMKMIFGIFETAEDFPCVKSVRIRRYSVFTANAENYGTE